jgi:hypothetical protein
VPVATNLACSARFFELAGGGSAPVDTEALGRIGELRAIDAEIRGRDADARGRRGLSHSAQRPTIAPVRSWSAARLRSLQFTVKYESPKPPFRQSSSWRQNCDNIKQIEMTRITTIPDTRFERAPPRQAQVWTHPSGLSAEELAPPEGLRMITVQLARRLQAMIHSRS